MHKRTRRKRLIRFYLLLIFLFLIGGIVGFFLLRPQTQPISADSPTQTTPTPIKSGPTPFPENSPGLTSAISNALNGSHGNYGIVIKNLKTNESYYQNATNTYQSGSLYKLWVMGEVFQELQQGKLGENSTVSKDLSQLYKEFDFQPDGTEQTDGTLRMSISDALYQMITISSNNAALLLTDKVTVKGLQVFLSQNHFTHSHVGIANHPPTTTPFDIASFFEKLYKGQLANTDSTNTMISLLKQQKLNDKIPKYLPNDTVIAHKTGELDSVTHDAGIVYSPDGDYLIVVLSQSDDPDLAKERIALVSQAVYNYFAGQTVSNDTSIQPTAASDQEEEIASPTPDAPTPQE